MYCADGIRANIVACVIEDHVQYHVVQGLREMSANLAERAAN